MRTSEVLAELDEIATTQHGYITRGQARNLGVTDVELVRLTKRGDIQRVEHGIYKFRGTGYLRWESVWVTWLRLDPERVAFERTRKPNEVVSGLTAAWVYEIGDLGPEPYEFIVANRHQTRRTDIRFRRGVLKRSDWEIVDGLPVTRPQRIIVDLLAMHVDGGHITDIAVDAMRHGLLSSDELRSIPHASTPDGFVEDVLSGVKH